MLHPVGAGIVVTFVLGGLGAVVAARGMAPQAQAAESAAGEAAPQAPSGVAEAEGSAGIIDEGDEGEADEVGEAILGQGGDDGAPLDSQQSSLVALFDDLGPQTLKARVETLYDPAAVYEGPFGRYDGREQLLGHLESLLGGAQELTVDVKEEFVSGEEMVTVWSMKLAHEGLDDEHPVHVDGISHTRWVGGRIAWQRDYYDVGSVVYERLPVIGRLVRWAKGRITGG